MAQKGLVGMTSAVTLAGTEHRAPKPCSLFASPSSECSLFTGW